MISRRGNGISARSQKPVLGYAMDGAGNQSAILLSDPPSENRILAGSHLDSVPNGGRYDGALGVLVALGSPANNERQWHRAAGHAGSGQLH